MLKNKMFSAMVVLSAMVVSIGAEANPRGGHFEGVHYRGYYHGHPSFGFSVGIPLYPRPYPYYPYYYPYYPYPYYPPQIVTVPTSPPVYIERGEPQSTQQLPKGYWYYCSDPEGYYPYVKECPSGWRQVEPVPPGSK